MIALATILVTTVTVGIGLLARLAGVGFSDLSRDPLSVAGGEFYHGGLSSAFVLAWWSTSVCCFFAGAVLRRRGQHTRARFLWVAGVITAWLSLDDLFQFHEVVVPVHLGIAEAYVHVVYIAALAAFVIVWRETILKTEFPVLAAAAAFFGMSSFVDVIIPRAMGKIPLEHLVEDGSKFVGIVLWLMYFGRVSLGWTMEAISPSEAWRRPRTLGEFGGREQADPGRAAGPPFSGPREEPLRSRRERVPR